jgi:adenylyl-sulfate kinase
VLDGDEMRRTLSADLGFSKDDRDANVLRVAALARRLVGEGRIVICSLISPYRLAREQARLLIGSGRFVEVFVDTPLSVCEMRDPKGLYARARRGSLGCLTGIDDPYEPPLHPDMVLTTTDCTVEQNVERILDGLVAKCGASARLAKESPEG